MSDFRTMNETLVLVGKRIEALLHDAALTDFSADGNVRRLSLFIKCLRRETPESDIIHSSVELRFGGVKALAVVYRQPGYQDPPSSLLVKHPLSMETLKDEWNDSVSHIVLNVNTDAVERTLLEPVVIDWLLQNEITSSDWRILLSSEAGPHSDDGLERLLYFECDELVAYEQGRLLTLEQWEEQYRAWWAGLHLRRGEDSDICVDTDEGDLFFSENLYCPPRQPAFLLENENVAPKDLLEPVRLYHEGLIEEDFQKVARAVLTFGRSEKVRAAELAAEKRATWIYARRINGWWQEKGLANVTICGIEHTAPDDENPPYTQVIVVSYALRRIERRWRIVNHFSVWPTRASLAAAGIEMPWLGDWGFVGDESIV